MLGDGRQQTGGAVGGERTAVHRAMPSASNLHYPWLLPRIFSLHLVLGTVAVLLGLGLHNPRYLHAERTHSVAYLSTQITDSRVLN